MSQERKRSLRCGLVVRCVQFEAFPLLNVTNSAQDIRLS